MKKEILLSFLSAVAISTTAQYKIDLNKVMPPSIHYLELGNPGPAGKEIRVNNLYMDIGGVPQLPVMGEFHYSRMDPRYWRDTLLKMKASGVNIVATYCLWSLHEEFEGELSWRGHLDLHRFVELCKEVGLKVHLRIGPYCNAEIKNGGLPDWMIDNKNFRVRTNDPLYLEYVRRWYEALYSQVKDFLYKNNGPVMAIQLENEYVSKGNIVSHLMNLKKMAVETGFDVPLYTMTHWMDSEYPRGEIVPYAGFYIEAPWTTTGKEEIPTSNFEFFTYNRLSDNIGTDIIKLEEEVESLSGENNDSPFFTCEVGVGSTTFYHRRAVVPEELAGEMINLRLGCGANLMGYYMYVGGSNPVGKRRTAQSSGPRISYDYQAPIREFGTLGVVMQETKKYNYFMNDFGTALAPAVAYLPKENQDRENLQWAVRSDGNSGYLFCSNYLYRHTRKDFKNVQFIIKLKNETFRIPRRKVTVKGGSYFLWPFNQNFGDVLVKYATVQPVCSMQEGRNINYFFFEDDCMEGEYCIDGSNIRQVEVINGFCRKEKKDYFINGLTAGKECRIEITQKDGSKVRFITLTEEESDQIWKGRIKGKDFVALSASSLIYDQDKITLIDDRCSAEIKLFKDGHFEKQLFNKPARHIPVHFRKLPPMPDCRWVKPMQGNIIKRIFTLTTFSSVEKAWLRYVSPDNVTCQINNKNAEVENTGEYFRGDITALIRKEENQLEFTLSGKNEILAEVEILMKNGERILWNTDGTWTSTDGKQPVKVMKEEKRPAAYAPAEHLAVYEVRVPKAACEEEETRMYISYKGDIANAYQGRQLLADSFYDGTDWIISISRLKEATEINPVIMRIEGLKSADAPVYFEKNVISTECIDPFIKEIQVKQEYRFHIQNF